MARLLLLICLCPTLAWAQFFNLPFGRDKDAGAASWESTLERIEGLSADDPAAFEAGYRELVQEAQKRLDLRRAECAEKNATEKNPCFQKLAAWQRRLLDATYGAKRKLLLVLHRLQLAQLESGRERAAKELNGAF